MTIGVLKEPEYENRVSLLPEAVAVFKKKGINILVENDAGKKSFSSDDDYINAGALIKNRKEVVSESEIILTLSHPEQEILPLLNNKIIIGIFQPAYHKNIMQLWAKNNITSFSLDMLPRTTRAQVMDVLSSQANIAGYKAVLLAAANYSRYFPMFMTAAGSIKPAKVLVLGAGVAGLQAIATSRRLGAVVEVFDTRPAVKEEVMSLGAKFIEVEGAADASSAGGYAVEQTEDYMKKQEERIGESVRKADIVITTAQIFGKKAPILIKEHMLKNMRKGSVIIDLAAATGGNTELTKNNETIQFEGVTIIGNSALASSMPSDASKLLGKNISNFIDLVLKNDGELNLNFEDDLVNGACITHNGQIVHAMIKEN